MTLPPNFKYRDAYLRGRPKHQKTDPFRIRHPVMDIGRRAKIFAPFDALRGFSAALLAQDAQLGAGSAREPETIPEDPGLSITPSPRSGSSPRQTPSSP